VWSHGRWWCPAAGGTVAGGCDFEVHPPPTAMAPLCSCNRATVWVRQIEAWRCARVPSSGGCTFELAHIDGAVRQTPPPPDIILSIDRDQAQRTAAHLTVVAYQTEAPPDCGESEDESLEDIKCMRCERPEHEELILLCDGTSCKSAYHIYCLSPPLDRVPEGKWFCASCTAAGRGATRQEALSQLQPQRPTTWQPNLAPLSAPAVGEPQLSEWDYAKVDATFGTGAAARGWRVAAAYAGCTRSRNWNYIAPSGRRYKVVDAAKIAAAAESRRLCASQYAYAITR